MVVVGGTKSAAYDAPVTERVSAADARAAKDAASNDTPDDSLEFLA